MGESSSLGCTAAESPLPPPLDVVFVAISSILSTVRSRGFCADSRTRVKHRTRDCSYDCGIARAVARPHGRRTGGSPYMKSLRILALAAIGLVTAPLVSAAELGVRAGRYNDSDEEFVGA